MDKPKIVLREERNFSGVINAVFGFIGQEFKPLFKAMLVYGSIPMLLAGIATAMYTKQSFENIGKPANSILEAISNTGVVGPWYFLTLLGTFIAYFIMSGITFAYLRLYREKGFGNFTTSDAWDLFVSKSGKLLGHQILASFIIFGFFLLLIIPGIYVAVPMSLVMMVAMEEDVTFGDNWKRCFYLIRDNWWATFGIIIVISIILSVLSSIASLPATIYTVVYGITKGAESNPAEMNTTFLSISFIVATFVKLLLYVILFVTIGIQYYNLVEQKDKVSLLDKINTISSSDQV
ncbi:MAG: hypothetical protein QM786_04070 [Breznakibacter sp.]